MDLSNENVIHVKKEEIEYLQFRRLLEYKDDITHAFAIGRNVDYRQPVYNKKCAMTVDQIEANKQNYKNLCNAIGIEYNNIVKTNQVHSANVQIINNKVNKDKPDFTEKCYEDIDGFITNKNNLAICTTNADCAVLMMFDTKKKIISNIHSGWRGTVQKIAGITIDKMQEVYKCNPKDIICCISPSIRKCHFEVDEDVKEIFTNSFKKLGDAVEKKNEKWHIDTVKINIDMLKEKGLRKENIIESKICTVCNSNIIHSYRGNSHKNGLEMAIVQLKALTN